MSDAQTKNVQKSHNVLSDTSANNSKITIVRTDLARASFRSIKDRECLAYSEAVETGCMHPSKRLHVGHVLLHDLMQAFLGCHLKTLKR